MGDILGQNRFIIEMYNKINISEEYFTIPFMFINGNNKLLSFYMDINEH